jgi:Cys-tRNA synthase (O-phospho-L-seryl-tRNA:Cys-tRNA synthase)
MRDGQNGGRRLLDRCEGVSVAQIARRESVPSGDERSVRDGRRQPNAVGLRGLREVLVDESAQYVATIETERQGSNDRIVPGHRHAEFEASVRPMLVVVPDVLPQNPCQVTAAKD